MKPLAGNSFKARTFAVGALAASALTCASVMALQNGPAAAANPAQFTTISLGQMFTYFFLMLGPLKILGPFEAMTRKGDAAFARKLALRGFLFSCLTLLIAGILGEELLLRYRISIPVLMIAAGVILFLVALNAVMQQFDSSSAAPKEYDPDLRIAISPLAFPTIVTPYGIAAVIICLALSPETNSKIEIFAALLCLMLLDLVAMLFAKPILRYLGVPMLLAGTILGVIQVALGLALIFRGLRALGFGTSPV